MSDLISREALKKALTSKDLITWTHEYGDAIPVDWLMSVINNAPTVEYTFEEAFQKTVCEQRLYCPERPQGEQIAWEQGYECGKNESRPQGEWKLHGMIYYCSVCGHDYEQGGNNFCGNCGAKMQEGGEENA